MTAAKQRTDHLATHTLPAFSATDASVLAGIPALIWPAWFVPERFWPAICRTLSPLAISDLTREPQAAADLIRRTLGSRLPKLTGAEILRDMASEGILTFFQVLKCYRLDGWVPAARLSHADRIARALDSGRGVILWVAHAFHGHLGAKVAFGQAGLKVCHLSRPNHGFSSSRFGVRYLNRIQTIVEDRHIAERVMLPMEGQNTALHVLARRLRSNGIVSITAQRGITRTVEAPFLDGKLTLAPGAPALAHMTGAALLPVFAFRGENGVVDVRVEPSLEVDTAAPRELAVADAVRRYAPILEADVLRYPGQWLGWVQL
jgi:lauroyl/myristoyl acyltransferase